MTASNAKRAVPAVAGNGPREADQLDDISSTVSFDQHVARIKLAEATVRVNAFIDTLQIVADWRDDWIARARRAQLCFETIGLSDERHASLVAEGRALTRVFRTLAASIASEPPTGSVA